MVKATNLKLIGKDHNHGFVITGGNISRGGRFITGNYQLYIRNPIMLLSYPSHRLATLQCKCGVLCSSTSHLNINLPVGKFPWNWFVYSDLIIWSLIFKFNNLKHSFLRLLSIVKNKYLSIWLNLCFRAFAITYAVSSPNYRCSYWLFAKLCGILPYFWKAIQHQVKRVFSLLVLNDQTVPILYLLYNISCYTKT